MKAIILAAGKGKRMRPFTDTTAKPLLFVGNRSLIEHNVIALVKADIIDLVINLHHFADKIQSHLGTGEHLGANIQYSHETKLLDTAGGILNAVDLIGADPFVVLNADIFTDYDFSRLINAFPLEGEPILGHLVLVDNPDHHPNGDYAISDRKVNGLSLLDPDADKKLTWSGISVLHPKLFDGLAPGRSPLRDLFLPAITAGRMTGEHFTGSWTDVGTPERLDLLNKA
ncbi:MAG: nucleotidyltransferase family protein [Gammaproteobacteria bacterium]|nr:nucleotidyltransferase family protein [Gammaproteobacteria bacterium]